MTDPYTWDGARLRAAVARLALHGDLEGLARLLYLHTTPPEARHA